ncbi:MAG: dihydroorotate dehydrogenase-like protein [Desulfuromonadales bacterium]
MIDLTTRYMGLELKNPLIVSSCGLTGTVEGVQQAAAAGAGAIVLKSLFEEQIQADVDELARQSQHSAHTEAYDYLYGFGRSFGPREYLQLVSEAKQAVAVPVFASVNCVSAERWTEYATKLADAGADGLELNIGFLPNDASLDGTQVEERYTQILAAVRAAVELPVALKIGPCFSSLAHLADRLGNDRAAGPPFTVGWCGPGDSAGEVTRRGADALVLFNRFYRFDIDIDTLQLAGGNPYSTSAELCDALRWISLLAGKVASDLAATTGVHNGQDLVKQVLAGATVVQVCSTLYRNGLGQIDLILDFLRDWMQAHGFARLEDFRGRLSHARSEDPSAHERMQYIKALVGIE